ncbi:MAG TPA: hypothetical protein VG963_30745 [Polyangiaceae bacterium]|nr:hypothetical protein [Polyangiaceae bacterium]
MKQALARPALQGAAGLLALIALTWPLLVFDRALYVVVSFFSIWAAVIGLLFLFSRAPTAGEHAAAEGTSDGGSDA